MKCNWLKSKVSEFTAPAILKLMHLFCRPYIVILNYHRVCDHIEPWEHSAINSETFKKQMLFLKKHFSIQPLDKLMDIDVKERFARPIAFITFDDGYRDFHDNAYPVLKELEIDSTLFLSTDAIENRRLFWWDHVGFLLWNLTESVDIEGFGTLHPKTAPAVFDDFVRYLKSIDELVKQSIISRIELSSDLTSLGENIDRLIMDWNHVKTVSSDSVLIGAHTHKHGIISKMSNDEFVNNLKTNLKSIEKNLGVTPEMFAYPNGKVCDYNDDTPDILESLGITHAFTTDSGLIKISNFRNMGRYKIGRINTVSSFPGFLARVSGIHYLLHRF